MRDQNYVVVVPHNSSISAVEPQTSTIRSPKFTGVNNTPLMRDLGVGQTPEKDND